MTAAPSSARTAPRKLAALGFAHLVLGWTATVIAPLWVLLLAPLFFGVPHVINDFRLLVLKPPAPVTKRLLLVVALPLTLLTALRGALLFGAPHLPVVEVGLGFSAVWGATWVATEGRSRLRSGLLPIVAALGLVCASRPGFTALALGHGHNLVAVALWIAYMGRALVAPWVQALLGALFLILSSSLLFGLVPFGSSASVAGLSFEGLRSALAPGLAPGAGDQVVMSFAFAQLVHYSIWVFLLPACASANPAPVGAPQIPPRAFEGFDFRGLAIGGIALIGLPALALLDATGARSAYLSLVLFHGWLEVALIIYWLAGRQKTEAREA